MLAHTKLKTKTAPTPTPSLVLTVAGRALAADHVLAAAYTSIYGDDAEISLIVNPLVATDEIVNLNAAGLMPRSLAIAAALGDVASAAAVKQAVAEAEKEDAEKKEAEDAKAAVELEGAKINNQKAQADLAATKADTAAADAASTPGSP